MQGRFSEARIQALIDRILSFPEPLRNKAYNYFTAEGLDSLAAISQRELEGLNVAQLQMKAERRRRGRVAGINKEWFRSKEIWVFSTPDADRAKLAASIEGMRRLFIYLNADFKVIDKGMDASITDSVNRSMRDGSLETADVVQHVCDKFGPKAAYFVIVGRPLPGVVDGFAYEHMHTVVLNPRYNPPGRISQHELMHLLNVTEHTGVGMVSVGSSAWKDYLESGYANEKLGYREDEKCLMVSYLPKSDYLCGKCRDLFIYYWKGVEETSGIKIFK
jgi:hypothetical protein